jgi:hypothetical protein
VWGLSCSALKCFVRGLEFCFLRLKRRPATVEHEGLVGGYDVLVVEEWGVGGGGGGVESGGGGGSVFAGR